MNAIAQMIKERNESLRPISLQETPIMPHMRRGWKLECKKREMYCMKCGKSVLSLRVFGREENRKAYCVECFNDVIDNLPSLKGVLK